MITLEIGIKKECDDKDDNEVFQGFAAKDAATTNIIKLPKE